MRRSLVILLLSPLFGACDRTANGEVVRSPTPEVSPAVRGDAGAERSGAGSNGDFTPPAAARPDAAAGAVVFLGTSLTEGYGLQDPSLGFPGVIDGWIRERGLPFRVVNAGVAGDTSAGGLARIDWVLRQPARLLVVELGANDGLRALPLNALEANLREVIARARALHPDVRIVLISMEAPTNLGRAYTEGFRETFVRVAREERVTLAPFLLEGVAGVAELNQSDGIHPTPEGHRRMAERLWTTLEPILLELASTSPAQDAA